MIKAMKFGGTSVGSERALRSLVSVVRQDQAGKVLVVSAMSGVTNHLLALMREERPPSDAVFDELLWKHTSAVQPMMPEEALGDLETKLRVRIGGLRQALERYQEPSSRTNLQDTVSSWGERLSSLMVASVLRSNGVDAIAMTSEEAGIVALGTPGNGTADLEATSRNFRRTVLPLVKAGKVPVITGYYGCDADGRPITFGRGGSDYSGSVVGYALDADAIEIWTDVDGFMSADPRVVPGARNLREMDYGEAAELAYFGAKVLHPRTIEPARKKRILVRVKNTFDPQSPGTCIRENKGAGGKLLKSVAAKGDLAVVKVYSSEIVYNPSLVMHLLATVSENGSTAYAISTSLSTLAFAVPSSAARNVCERLRRYGDGEVEFVVPSEKANEVVRKLHDKFIGV
ncbi:MAG: aspartate kinase [Methanomassiliicoccales archaeon]|nr:aspartate kinase [Methanomassiliicoccales archaeon]